MAYDAATGQLVLFGGYLCGGFSNQTWVWSGSTWSQLSPTTSPPGRDFASMAYDPATKQLILFGGGDNGANGAPLDDTWGWNGSTWTQLSPQTVPTASFGGSMAFDSATGQLIKFGGNDGYQGYTDNNTYIWTGTNWSLIQPSTSPPGRWGASMAYDAAQRQLVLYGGVAKTLSQPPTGPLNDTWLWNGSNWINPIPAGNPNTQGPPPRSGAAMDFAPSTNELVLFGGSVAGSGPANDTWTWTGSVWNQLSPPNSPPPMGNPVAAYDPGSSQFVLNGASQTWLWVPVATTQSPTTTGASSPPSGAPSGVGSPTTTTKGVPPGSPGSNSKPDNRISASQAGTSDAASSLGDKSRTASRKTAGGLSVVVLVLISAAGAAAIGSGFIGFRRLHRRRPS